MRKGEREGIWRQGAQGKKKTQKEVGDKIREGDKVYQKNLININKLTSDWDQTQHTVISKDAGDMRIKDDNTGQEYRRNVIHLKKIAENWIIQEQTGQQESKLKNRTEKKLKKDVRSWELKQVYKYSIYVKH